MQRHHQRVADILRERVEHKRSISSPFATRLTRRPGDDARGPLWDIVGTRVSRPNREAGLANPQTPTKRGPVELGERSLVALNKIRAFVRTLGKIDSAKKESSEGVSKNDQGDSIM
jgi:hypothetical protein